MERIKKMPMTALLLANVALFGLAIAPASASAERGLFCDPGQSVGCGCIVDAGSLPDGCYEHNYPSMQCWDLSDCHPD
jgi:hypothetical protein